MLIYSGLHSVTQLVPLCIWRTRFKAESIGWPQVIKKYQWHYTLQHTSINSQLPGDRCKSPQLGCHQWKIKKNASPGWMTQTQVAVIWADACVGKGCKSGFDFAQCTCDIESSCRLTIGWGREGTTQFSHLIYVNPVIDHSRARGVWTSPWPAI